MGETSKLAVRQTAPATPPSIPAFFPPFSRALSVFFLLLVAVLWSGIHLLTNGERETQLNHAGHDLDNLSRTVAEQIKASVHSIDLSLLTLRDDWQRNPAAFAAAVRRQQNYFVGRIGFQVAIIDAEGLLSFSNLSQTIAKSRPLLADREHFRVHADGKGDRLFISRPVFGRVSQRWSIQFTRPLLDKNDAFKGVIVLSVDPEHFARQFDSIELGRSGIISLLRAEGELLARSPRLENAIGQLTSNRPFLDKNAPEAGRYERQSQIDGVHRLFSWRRLPDLGLVVITGRSTSDILARPEQERRRFLVGGTIVTVFLALIYLILFAVLRQRAATAAALATSEARLRILIETLPDQIWMKDPQGVFIVSNPAFEKMLQTDAGKILGHSCEDIVGEEQAARFRAHDQAAIEAGRAVTQEEWLTPPAGPRVLLETTKVPVRAHGELLGVLAIARDITARKQAEAALLQSNTDLEQFAYSVSHDMRQPLRMVTGHLQLLARSLGDQLDADSRENLNFALDGARRMDAMIVSLLDYSRVGRKTESKRWLESREVLDEALEFLSPAIEDTGASIAIEGSWPLIFASRDEMSRLLQNLIGNALKYREPGEAPRIEIRSETTVAPGAGGKWRVAVRDHGIGIDPRQAGRLFQFFSRLQSHARFEGCGMGLALCRRIAEHHDGSIHAESAGEGQGSTFVFELPVPAVST